MPVEKAREHIRAFLAPVTAIERLNIRAALGRVLAEDVMSPVNVPQHDNSAMDGYAVRFADLKADGETTLGVIGTSFAGKPFDGHRRRRGNCAHHDRGCDTGGRRHSRFSRSAPRRQASKSR